MQACLRVTHGIACARALELRWRRASRPPSHGREAVFTLQFGAGHPAAWSVNGEDEKATEVARFMQRLDLGVSLYHRGMTR